MLKRHEKTLAYSQKLLDASCVALSWSIAYYIRFKYFNGQGGLGLLFLKLTPLTMFFTVWSFHKSGLYRSQRYSNKIQEIFTVFKSNAVSIILFILFLYFFAENRVSRATLILHFILSTFLLTIARMMVRNFLRVLRRKGRNLRHILLVGNGIQLKDYVMSARKFKDSGLNILGWVDSDGIAKKFKVKSYQSYEEVLKKTTPDSIVLGYQGKDNIKVTRFLKTHYNDVTPIQILPDLSYSFVGHQIEDFAGIPLLTVNQPNFSSTDLFIKRSVDLIGSFLGLIILSPLFFLIGLIIKITSPGPILYSQTRVGLDGEKFEMLKFRSMDVAKNGEDLKTWGSKDNPRKTKFGSFLRKSSLDELPQLINVLFGSMSLIGPRPERPHFVNQFRKKIPGYMLRHKMRAGITGWAQINGWRGDTSIEKRIECDIYYIKHWTLWFDLKIFFLTFWKGFINKNAY